MIYIALTLTPLLTKDRRVLNPSFDIPKWSIETAGRVATVDAISDKEVESIYNSVCQPTKS